MSEAQHIAYLLYKELEGQISSDESIELNNWKLQFPEHTEFFEQVMNEDQLAALIKANHPDSKGDIRQEILSRLQSKLDFKVVPIYRRGFFRIAVAACIAALIFVGGYFIFFNDKKGNDIPPIAKTNDIQPPKDNKAMIKLPDGTDILLDTLTTINQGNITVTKTADGRIIYTGFGEEVKFNTLTNPRGNKVIDIELSDKSHVWLNAGSSITYPIAFNGNDRKVTMTGEVAFQVTHDARKPFTVTKGEVSVTVLGTEFNINAYEDEPNIKVTLLEGSVKVNSNQRSLTIKPNQQAVVSGGSVDLNTNVNLEEVMAWRNGKFYLNNSSIESIMREVSRWYDVEVIYEGKIPGGFDGGLSRNNPISKLLQIMEASNRVHFEIEGRTIKVKP